MPLRISRIARSASLGALLLVATASEGMGSGLPYFHVADLGVRQGVALNDAGQVALNQVDAGGSIYSSYLSPTQQTYGTNTEALLYSSYGPHAGMMISPAQAIATSDPANYTLGLNGQPVTPTTAWGLTQSGEMLVNAGGYWAGTYSADLGNAKLVNNASTGLETFAMDNAGRLIAIANPTGSAYQGVIVEGMKVTSFLKMPDGTPIVPTGMDSAGRILGTYETQGNSPNANVTHAVVVDHGTITEYKGLGGSAATLAGINAAGDVAGTSSTSPASGYWQHAFAILGGVTHDLGTLGGLTSQATGINNMGEVVGNSNFVRPSATWIPNDPAFTTHPFLYESGKMIDLNSLVSPSLHLKLVSAVSINNNGQVLVEGYYGTNYQESTYLLTPDTMFNAAAVTTAPEPGSLAILGLGALLIGLRRRFSGRA